MTAKQQQEAVLLLQQAQRFLVPLAPDAGEMTMEQLAASLDEVFSESAQCLELGDRIGQFLQQQIRNGATLQ
jgi:hypothetical protein